MATARTGAKDKAMRLDQTITCRFPKLAKFIEREVPAYRFKPQVFNAFKRFGQFKTDADAAVALTFGTSDPIIDARMTDDFGVYFWSPRNPDNPPKKNRKI